MKRGKNSGWCGASVASRGDWQKRSATQWMAGKLGISKRKGTILGPPHSSKQNCSFMQKVRPAHHQASWHMPTNKLFAAGSLVDGCSCRWPSNGIASRRSSSSAQTCFEPRCSTARSMTPPPGNLPADAPLPAPPELRAAAIGAMQQVRRQRQAAGSLRAQDEEDDRLAAMVLSGRWQL